MLGLDVYFPMLIYLYYLFQVMTVVCVSGIWRPKPAFKRSQHTAKNLTKVYSTLPSTPQYLTSPVLERTHWPKFLSLIRYYSSLLRFTREAPHSARPPDYIKTVRGGLFGYGIKAAGFVRNWRGLKFDENLEMKRKDLIKIKWKKT